MNSNKTNIRVAKSFLIVDLLEINEKTDEKLDPTEQCNGKRKYNDEDSDEEEPLTQSNKHTKYNEYYESNQVSDDVEYNESHNESYNQDSGNNSRSSRSRSRSKSPSRSRSRSSSSSCNLKKNRKSRTAFSDYQLNSLEKSFEKHKYLSVQDRIELATRLSLTDTQVKTWYQNRRTKWKRQSSLGIEWLMAAAAAEHSSVLQYSNNCIGNTAIKSTGQEANDSQADHANYAFNNNSNNLFQYSSLFCNQNADNKHEDSLTTHSPKSALASSLSSSSSSSISSATSSLSSGSSINNWFINALTQYTIANKNPAASNNNLNEQNTFCY